MTVSEALNKVGAAYVPGVVAHYDRFKPDPWQKAHDELEKLLFIQDEAIISAALEGFVSECLKLIKAFQETSVAPLRITSADAFHMGDEQRVSQWQSRRHKHCVKCERKENLTLVTDPKDPLNTLIICKECKARGAA